MTLRNIQILRFAAAAGVIGYHVHHTMTDQGGDPLSLLRYGHYGVDLFFVISGFIIAWTAMRRPQGWRDFAWNRITRIVPLYWLLTGALAAIVLAAPQMFSVRLTPELAIHSFTFTSFAVAQNPMPLLYPGWTLDYEMAFYILATVLLATTARPWLWLPCILAGLVMAGTLMQPGGVWVNFLTAPMLLEFAMGVVMAQFRTEGRIPALPLASIVGALLALGVTQPASRVLLAGLPSVAIVALALACEGRWTGETIVARVMVRLGDASYSLYLAQVFPLAVLGVLPPAWLPANVTTQLLVETTVVIAFGFLIHRVAEMPLLALARRARNFAKSSH